MDHIKLPIFCLLINYTRTTHYNKNEKLGDMEEYAVVSLEHHYM